jgi:hypothetical protein
MMKITEVLKMKRYLALAIMSSAVMSLIYIYTQVLGIVENIDLWLTVIPWYNAALFIIFAALFGITFAYQVYLWKQPKVCAIGTKAKGFGTSGIGSIGLFFVAQCPACASLGALFLPISVSVVFTKFSWLITLASIGLLLFTLNYLGAFKKN